MDIPDDSIRIMEIFYNFHSIAGLQQVSSSTPACAEKAPVYPSDLQLRPELPTYT
jgi:hypothetical protein